MSSAPVERQLAPGKAAKILGVDRKTVSRWASDPANNIRVYTTPGGHRRYNQDDIFALLNTRKGTDHDQ